MTKSKHNQTDNDVYKWIRQLQNDSSAEDAKERLVLHYERLVHSLANKYSYNRSNHEDLYQVGMIGLLTAANRFDESFGRSFEAFAVPTIIGEIKRYIRDKTWSVNVPRRIKEYGPKINRALDYLTTKNQQSPTIAEIAAYLEISEEDVLETMEMTKSYKALSVDYQYNVDDDGGAVTMLDVLGEDESNFEKKELQMLLERIIPILPKREQLILQHIFFEQLSQQEVASILGMSQMHVSRLQRQALQKLREVLEEEMYI